MVLVSHVTHYLVEAAGVQVTQQPTEDVRLVQSGIGGEVICHRGGLDRHLGRIDADCPHIGDVGSVRQVSGVDFLPGAARPPPRQLL